MFDANVNDIAVQFEGQTEDVVLIRTIANDKRAFRFVLQQLLGLLAGDRAPVPAAVYRTKLRKRRISNKIEWLKLMYSTK